MTEEALQTQAQEVETQAAAQEAPPAFSPAITAQDVRRAGELLRRYKAAKAPLEARIIEDEQWYKLQHWDYIAGGKRQFDAAYGWKEDNPRATSAWLFSAIDAKHADAMDNYPQPDVLPRAEDDSGSARVLSKVLPVVLERAEFEETYDLNWWEKLKHGTGVYGVYWDSGAENGLGDIAIRRVDLLNLFWEPGISDLQRSRNVFLVDAVDNDILLEQYPFLAGKLGGDIVQLGEYLHGQGEMGKDTQQEKSLVVDWYYKVRRGERTVLHLCKFVGDNLLFASENLPEYRQRGWYEHGQYPFVLDVLYPEKDTPVGFGMVSVSKNPQIIIDKLSNDMLINAEWCSRPRYFASEDCGINEDDFKDTSRQIVYCSGSVDERKLRTIPVSGMDSAIVNLLDRKITELKETSSNRDASNGGVSGGVTSAAGLSAMQEAGNKVSRDRIAASYRAYRKICYQCVDLMRQFYTQERTFRITGEGAGASFACFDAGTIRPQLLPEAWPGQYQAQEPVYRLPVFDIVIRAEKRNPYSQLTQMEYAKEFYSLGFFNPDKAQEALGALSMMEFEGKNKVVQYVQQGQTLTRQLQELMGQMDQMAALLQSLTGKDMGLSGDTDTAAAGETADKTGTGAGSGLGKKAVNAAQYNTKSTYARKLAERAMPDLSRAAAGTGVQ